MKSTYADFRRLLRSYDERLGAIKLGISHFLFLTLGLLALRGLDLLGHRLAVIGLLLIVSLLAGLELWMLMQRRADPSDEQVKAALEVLYWKHSDPLNGSSEVFHGRQEKLQLLWKQGLLTAVVAALLFVASGPERLASLGSAFAALNPGLWTTRTGVDLIVNEGLVGGDGEPAVFQLGFEGDTEIDLLPQNFVTLKFRSVSPPTLGVVVTKTGGLNHEGQKYLWRQTATHEYQVELSIESSSELTIPDILSDAPLAHFSVKAEPIPEVKLILMSELPKDDEGWPDDQPLLLRIEAFADEDLHELRLLIRTSEKESSETVSRFMKAQKKTSTTYELVLESYVTQPRERVEIVAEAIDKAQPKAHVGRSAPIVLEVVSAYGRYQRVLALLRQARAQIDEALVRQKKPDEKLQKDLNLAADLSKRSTFFDQLDRAFLERFFIQAADLLAEPQFHDQGWSNLTAELARFLLAHETLDDRERDRDMFVALRRLSTLERAGKDLKPAFEKLQQFVEERHKRWEQRVQNLEAKHRPKSAPEILSKKPFSKAVQDLAQSPESRQEKFNRLSADYKKWIDELEASEDAYREEVLKEKREGLVAMQNQLKELQARQDTISKGLDRPQSRPEKELESAWGILRMEQNDNLRKTKQLEAQMRSLFPQASRRLSAAVGTMELVKESGEQKQYGEAESASDLASRLLRTANHQAQRELAEASRTPRGARRPGNDSMHGDEIAAPLEINHEYMVDPSFREDILRESQKQIDANPLFENKEEREFLTEYLKQAVR